MVMSKTRSAIRKLDGLTVIELGGDINATAEEELTKAYEEASSTSAPTVLLDFEEVGYINSTGIALIVGLMARARKEGRRIAASGLSDHYREIFEITRLSDFMDIYPDKSAAIEKTATDEGGSDA
jgi:anti-sigma B factor antagonist